MHTTEGSTVLTTKSKRDTGNEYEYLFHFFFFLPRSRLRKRISPRSTYRMYERAPVDLRRRGFFFFVFTESTVEMDSGTCAESSSQYNSIANTIIAKKKKNLKAEISGVFSPLSARQRISVVSRESGKITDIQ